MYNRAAIVEDNFKKCLSQNELPQTFDHYLWQSQLIPAHLCVEIFESQLTSRVLDLKTRELRAEGESFYTIGSAGHEGNAAIGAVLNLGDVALLHYRNAPFMIQRSKQLPGQTIVFDMLLSFVASSEDPISGGRHKVLGSKALNIPPQTSTIASHLPKAIGMALAIPRKVDLKFTQRCDDIVLCSFGDASLNHASAQSAINTACWISYQNIPLPLLYVCEDNGTGISVRTPEDWVRNNIAPRRGIKYFYCNGLNFLEVFEVTRAASDYVRKMKKPAFLHVKTVRLLGHAGSDIETNYRSLNEVELTEADDPILHSAQILIKNKILTPTQVLQRYRDIRDSIERISKIAVSRPKLSSSKEVVECIVPPGQVKLSPLEVHEAERERAFGREWKNLGDMWQMNKLINFALKDLMLRYPEILVFGEDVAKKGGVYNVTHGLSKSFGQKRVFNSPLDETNILGTAIGFASSGFLPIPEIQFLAYVHNAEDQIRGEASTLSFFSKGQFANPMVIRIAGLAYQKGFGGHFHNDNSINVFRDLPGVIVACPSNGRDAVLMLRACVREAYENQRVCIFIEPIALYKTKDLIQVGDEQWASSYPADTNLEITVGEMGIVGDDDHDICVLTYGNGYYMSCQARQKLEESYGIKLRLIDLRWLAPLNHRQIAKELKNSSHVLIVDECRKSGSLSEELVTLIVEHCQHSPRIKRLTSDDSFIPLGEAADLVLLQTQDIIDGCLELLGRLHE